MSVNNHLPCGVTPVLDDVHWMRQALQCAERSLYLSAPNPRVGCVIVQDQVLLASGFTQRVGQAHAEIMALEQAQALGFQDLSQSTFYVSLEPCSHHGRTRPCVDEIIRVRPKRVVIAMPDPNPQVSGRGIERLRAAGIEVVVGVLLEQAAWLNVGFVSRMLSGRPWLWLKIASSMDGYTALEDGRSQWITGAAARERGHEWRARSDLIVTGSGTIRADNPLLNVRAVPTVRPPLRGVFDGQLRLSPALRFFQQQPVMVWACEGVDPAHVAAFEAQGVYVRLLPANQNGKVDLQAWLAWLGQQEFNEIHVEAGAQLNGALLQAGLVDQVVGYVAPTYLMQGRPAIDGSAPVDLDAAWRLNVIECQKIGADVELLMRNEARWQQLLNQLIEQTERL
ncbi:MAG TPA: bifunctional diaminohydroxyphosphoribosylaminopyrimidine deaminase/5-amino-6-(5-phosphoribosylamino)uracil reductase RibD [Paenalcaligenes sp.]|nr:bifunctional diaminohydroxyphosphoribosylaminopyrimidine deaminase/5-amino-6-(5-phosphoribosylamino)uracil reductase RibD [Paenalcaligenes sp.]